LEPLSQGEKSRKEQSFKCAVGGTRATHRGIFAPSMARSHHLKA
jgi:hypothetical protein